MWSENDQSILFGEVSATQLQLSWGIFVSRSLIYFTDRIEALHRKVIALSVCGVSAVFEGEGRYGGGEQGRSERLKNSDFVHLAAVLEAQIAGSD